MDINRLNLIIGIVIMLIILNIYFCKKSTNSEHFSRDQESKQISAKSEEVIISFILQDDKTHKFLHFDGSKFHLLDDDNNDNDKKTAFIFKSEVEPHESLALQNNNDGTYLTISNDALLFDSAEEQYQYENKNIKYNSIWYSSLMNTITFTNESQQTFYLIISSNNIGNWTSDKEFASTFTQIVMKH
jgi:hypothetical protein